MMMNLCRMLSRTGSFDVAFFVVVQLALAFDHPDGKRPAWFPDKDSEPATAFAIGACFRNHRRDGWFRKEWSVMVSIAGTTVVCCHDIRRLLIASYSDWYLSFIGSGCFL